MTRDMMIIRIRPSRWLVLSLVVISLILMGHTLLQSAPSEAISTGAKTLRQELSIARPNQDGQEILPSKTIPLKVGIQLKNVYNLQLALQTYSADGWYWVAWTEELNEILQQENLRPGKMIDFFNQVEPWNSRIEPETSEPRRLPDGSYYQTFRFSGNFYIAQIGERRSPFSSVQLQTVLETRPESFAFSNHAVVLEPDPNMTTIVGNYSELSGYKLEKGWIEQSTNTYPISAKNTEETFSQLSVNVLYSTEPWSAFMTWILPLLIVMIIVLLAPSLDSLLEEVRLAIPSTALLTLVLMQQSYKSELPAIPYLTFLDKIYAYCYLISLGLFILFLWSSNQLEAVKKEEKDTLRIRLNHIGTIGQISAWISLILVALIAWFL
ncbi:hypothetical protein [Synechococcus elongatus]|uniref:Neurotransmitter-gated ion-channel ligand-binding domain-containing protein n=2 Tax=Synechococcus elongatus TaxID=32046 RepID=A0AAN1QQ70_SYNEL|nr:hypothetical protein [Synechococcus elongatus]